ncbi:efflux RND transporter permease subunit, partial [Geofilum rubicundum]|uniref:efflux RND transporter permease subunit n=1 Tax=Geofilum rubicundum TaxID=472113 RepID=UPI00078343CC
KLDHIQSESFDGRALLNLRFAYGADVNYAFIDVNEKTDEALRSQPADMERPAIIKASASDLPVFYVNIWMDDKDPVNFMALSDLTRSVLIKRLEQLPEIAMVDVTGHLEPELYIQPDDHLLRSLGITHGLIEEALQKNNLSMGSISVADGQYRFNIRFSNHLRTVEDVKNIRLRVGDRMMKLEDLAEVQLRPKKQEGVFLHNGIPALSLAVIKQADARMDELKEKTESLLDHFKNNYEGVHFEIVRDQTAILDYSIRNLQTNLIFGGLLAFIILFFFLRDARSPWLIGISVPVSLVVSLLFFHLTGLSINIISLSGLILGIGMIIDNSIIVIDNITHYREKGDDLATACVRGTNEVIRPLISSVLTTCAVFVPLVFISGMAGALFYDQAMAVGIGLVASLLVSITLIPVLYHLFHPAGPQVEHHKGKVTRMLERINLFKTEDLYERGFDRVFRHRRLFFIAFLGLLLPGLFLGWNMKKEQFPTFTHDDVFLELDWNAGIHIEENIRRVNLLKQVAADYAEFSNSYTGSQNFVLHKDMDQSVSEASLYFKCATPAGVTELKEHLSAYLTEQWPEALWSFSWPETVFEKLFSNEEAELVLHLSDQSPEGIPDLSRSGEMVAALKMKFPHSDLFPPASEDYAELRVRTEMMTLYDVDYQVLINRLRSSLNAWHVGVLHTGSQYVPMVIGHTPIPVNRLLDEIKVMNRTQVEIPVSALLYKVDIKDYKVLHGGSGGVFVPINIEQKPEGAMSEVMNEISHLLFTQFNTDVSFSGSWFESRKMVTDLAIILLISLVLLYFILAAQFESLRQPVILLLEVPLDVSGALFLLWLFGGSINVMAMIGIVVMSGIVVNDSILKVDTINRLYRSGMPLVAAIKEGGHRRLKPIIMTSVTTILALLPVLWGTGMGSELQRPLALTVIGGMVLGTFVSLYFIPLCYYFLYRKA